MRYWKLPALQKTGERQWNAGEMVVQLILAHPDWRETLAAVRRYNEVYDLLALKPDAGTVVAFTEEAHELLIRIGKLPAAGFADPATAREYMRLYESLHLAGQEPPEPPPPEKAAP